MANAEINQIVQIIGLKFNEYNKKENLKFDKIIITTDADYDGAHISSLLLVMFNTYFPELFEQHMVYRCLSPIIIATKGKERKKFYTMKEYEAEKNNLNGYSFKYFKGLGGQSLEDYKYMLGPNKKLELFQKDTNADLSIHKWFGKKTAKDRKDAVKDEV
jgi:DNA topoisomerase-2